MVVASVWGTAFTVAAAVLALWSLWWIVRGALTNVDEREAEVAARERVAQGGAWEDEGEKPIPFTDDELQALSDAQRADDPAAAGVDPRPRPADRRRRFGSNKR